jgi:hypothetical protein
MWDSFENRKFVRIQKECGISVNHADHNEVLHSITENVGVGGLCANLPCALEPFSKVRIKIIFSSGGEPFECDARVAWSIKHRDFDPKEVHYDVGFEFNELSPEHKKCLEDFLATKS